MERDFNKPGERYEYLALGEQRADFGALSDRAYECFNQTQHKVLEGLDGENSDEVRLSMSAHSCLQRLTAFLLHSSRFASHAQNLYKIVPPPRELIGVRGAIDATCIDFETLLFFGRAALDRLSFHIASEIYGQNSDRFSKLQNVLKNFKEKDERAMTAYDLIDTAMPAFQGVIIDQGSSRSLRSALIHRRSFDEIIVTTFTVQGLKDGRILRFDFEVQQHPVIASARSLSQFIPFVILNTLGLYTGVPTQLAPADCEVPWENQTVAFSQYIDPTNSGPRFSVLKMLPNGFKVVTRHLKPSVLDFADYRVQHLNT